jgi:DMSO/TMAO reductase YedYZ molybdopterin-dependent catalytic subunit
MADDDGISYTGQVREKLVQAKEQWARDGRLLTGLGHSTRRLPPGQRQVQDWPVLDLGITPNIPTREWNLTVAGAVEKPFTWSWEDFRAQPQVQMTSDIHCVTAWSRYDNLWEGVSTRHFLSVARPRREARHVVLRSYDGYATNLTLERFAAEDALIAHSWEGKPLSQEHGGPVRLIVPKLYLWKSAKWIRQITFLEKDAPGYWEVRGYHNEGDPWKEERYG